MKPKILFLLLLLNLLFLPCRAQAQEDLASQLIALVNQLRTSYGFVPYRVDFILTNVAQVHANWLAANDLNTHLGPEGLNPDQRAKEAGYGAGYNAYVIENIAYGSQDIRKPEPVISIWQKDKESLNAMISPNYEHIGVGYVEAYEKTWIVMMVGWIDEEEPAVEGSEGDAQKYDGGSTDANSQYVIRELDETGALYHEVQPGQSAWTIASFYQIDLWDLLALNNLSEDAILQPGDVLLIRPASTETPTMEPSLQPATATPLITATSEAPDLTQDSDNPPESLETTNPTDSLQEKSLLNQPVYLIGIATCIVLFIIFIYRLIPRRF